MVPITFLHGHFLAVEESPQSCSQIAENQTCKLNTTFEEAGHLQEFYKLNKLTTKCVYQGVTLWCVLAKLRIVVCHQ